MIFAINDKTVEIQTVEQPNHFGSEQSYTFNLTKEVTEEEMFRYYKKNYFINESKRRINNSKSNLKQYQPDIKYAYTGAYIIPKLFGYFPLLDCDEMDTYEEAKFNLTLDEIPYVAFKSHPINDHYWIFCDKQGTLQDTIEFIESYPCDHRYAWIAKYKKELCVRAVPKIGKIPTLDDEYLVNTSTDDFAFWISQFKKYWNEGLIPKYLELIDTCESI